MPRTPTGGNRDRLSYLFFLGEMGDDFQMSPLAEDCSYQLGVEVSRVNTEPVNVFRFKRTDVTSSFLVMAADGATTADNDEAFSFFDKTKDEIFKVFQKGGVDTAVWINQ